ncbi:MAG TPA: Gfo/Idh/MocA family oxidoreductase [Clostridiaceae bacterium]|jgi:UDP-N-acetylglucosamine 3-dehydrogenase|nr:Gfo/Idh/MocA family oxidoreductase [Clostridiaceae bacterium]
MKKGKLLNVAVVGCGDFGEKHARIFEKLPIANLLAVCDVNQLRADGLAGKINAERECDEEQVQRFYDIEDMLQTLGDRLDACSVAVSEHFHYIAAKPIIEAKKALLLEKPIAHNGEYADKIMNLVSENNSRMMVGQVLKFDPKYQTMAACIERGEFGEVTNMYLERTSTNTVPKRLSGSISMYHYMGVHDFEAMLTFAGKAKPVKVYAQAVNKVNKKYHGEAAVNEGDATFNTITFDNGTIAVIHLFWAHASDSLGFVARAHIFGTKATGYIDIKKQGIEIFRKDEYVDYPEMTYWPEFNDEIQGALKAELLHFCEATLSGRPYIVDNARAVLAVKVIDACRKSLETGMPVLM